MDPPERCSSSSSRNGERRGGGGGGGASASASGHRRVTTASHHHASSSSSLHSNSSSRHRRQQRRRQPVSPATKIPRTSVYLISHFISFHTLPYLMIHDRLDQGIYLLDRHFLLRNKLDNGMTSLFFDIRVSCTTTESGFAGGSKTTTLTSMHLVDLVVSRMHR